MRIGRAMRRDVRRDEQHLVERERVARGRGGVEVADMDRVEGAAEERRAESDRSYAAAA